MRRDTDITFLLFLFITLSFLRDVFSDCGEPAPSANTYRTLYNSSVEYRCLDNYVLTSGNLSRACVNGSFTGIPPVCTLNCGPTLDSGYAEVTNDGFETGSVLTYTCKDESLVTMTTTECDGNLGYWEKGDLCFENVTLNMASFSAVQSSTAVQDVAFSNNVSSSTPSPGDVALFAAANAIDTNTNTSLLSGGCSSTALEHRPSLNITLDSFYTIYQIVVVLPDDDFATSLPNLHIKSSSHLGTMYDCEKYTSAIPKASRHTAICRQTRYPAWGKYIQIETDFGTETGMLQICNIEIYARTLYSVDCGQPIEIPNAVILNQPSHTKYDHSAEKVYYSCIEGYTVKSGRSYSYCNVNGYWTSTRVCTDDENLSNEKNVWLSTNTSEMLPLLTDFNSSSCIFLTDVTEATFIIDMENDVEVNDVSVTFFDSTRTDTVKINIQVWRDNEIPTVCESVTHYLYRGETSNVDCNYSPVGRYVSVHVSYEEAPLEICEFMVHGRNFSDALECYRRGTKTDYKGRMNMTVTGIPCQRWDSQTPHPHNDTDVSKFPDGSLSDAANYCRNPDEKYGLWCYTTDPDVLWQYCPVRQCDVMCLLDPRGTDYRGYTLQTSSGKNCVTWDSENVPFKRTSHFSNMASRYCRNPLHSQSRPWCYTAEDASTYGLCSLPACPTSSNLVWGRWVMDADQTLSDFLPAHECFVWQRLFTDEGNFSATANTAFVPRFYRSTFTVTQVCPSGQVFNTTFICSNIPESGSDWKTGVLECINCGPPPSVDNTTVAAPSSAFNGVAKYTCVSGYAHASGSDNITCLKTGQWENPDMVCQVHCGSPPLVNNTQPSNTSGFVNSSVVLTCLHGYVHVSGSNTITCLSTGDWQQPDMVCEVDCGPPPSVNNTDVVVVNTSLDSTAMYTCDTRYVHVTGSTNVTCTETGDWDEPKILCVVDCGPPPDVVNTNWTMNSSLENSTAEYTCSEGYAHSSGSTQITCQRNGNWSMMTMNCSIDCADPPQVPNATFTTSGTWSGSTAQYRCDVGFVQVSGSVDILCLQNGTWENTSIVCEVITTTPPTTSLQTTTSWTLRNVTDRYGRYRYQSCLCRCRQRTREQEDIISEISRNLLLNTRELISYTMKKESLPDERPTSHGMAYMAMSLIVALFAVVFVSDFYHCYAGVRRFCQAKHNPK